MAAVRLDRSAQINGWLFIAPALVLLGLFLIYPILWSLWMSFQVGKGLNFHFGGLANIQRLAQDPVFIRALTNTCIFLFVQVPIMITLALLFAVALNDSTLWGRGILPHRDFPAVRDVAGRLLRPVQVDVRERWRHQQHPHGAPHHRHADPVAERSVLGEGRHHPRHHLALDRLQHDLLPGRAPERRPVDLRDRAHRRRAAVGALRPHHHSAAEAGDLFTTVISTIGTLQLFDEVNNITVNGSPADATLTLSLYIYNLTFRFMPSYGYAATVSYVIVVVVAILSVIQFYIARDRHRPR